MTPEQVQAMVTPTAKREDIAVAYAELILEWGPHMSVADLNKAIVNRWSLGGLKWIKERAWKLAREVGK